VVCAKVVVSHLTECRTNLVKLQNIVPLHC
jgi:hypothetical protein